MSEVPQVQTSEALYTLGQKLYNLGDLLLYDDRFDIGYLAYKNRPHFYNGKLEKDHPSILHHWPIGIAAMITGGFLGTMATLLEMHNATTQEQEESFNNKELEDSYSRY